MAEQFRGLDEANFRRVEVRNEKFDGAGWLQVDGRRPAPPAVAAAPAASSTTNAAADGDYKWDFFVSYAQADEDLAAWVVELLQDNDHRVHSSYQFDVPGANEIEVVQAGMKQARRTIAVLTTAYVESSVASSQWQFAWGKDPQGVARRLIPIRFEDCEPEVLMQGITPIDMVGR
nr:toll/interleukin-1 receptor domain-containing protein [Micromonospora sp. DSM 115978]